MQCRLSLPYSLLRGRDLRNCLNSVLAVSFQHTVQAAKHQVKAALLTTRHPSQESLVLTPFHLLFMHNA